MRPPPTQRIPIHRIQQSLTDRLKQLIRPQPGLPQPLARPEQLIARRPAHDEVLGEINTPNTIEPANERLPRLRVQSRDNGGDEPGAEALFVQRGGDEVCKGLWAGCALFAQAVQVGLVAQGFVDGGDVGGEAGQAQVEGGGAAEGEDFGVVVGDCESGEAEAEVAGYGYAAVGRSISPPSWEGRGEVDDLLFPGHGYAGAAIWNGGLALRWESLGWCSGGLWLSRWEGQLQPC